MPASSSSSSSSAASSSISGESMSMGSGNVPTASGNSSGVASHSSGGGHLWYNGITATKAVTMYLRDCRSSSVQSPEDFFWSLLGGSTLSKSLIFPNWKSVAALYNSIAHAVSSSFGRCHLISNFSGSMIGAQSDKSASTRSTHTI